ncbi:hypothetical protein [Rhodopseudomonas sp.]|uniref:hypothetical protein n=1 Tax=Rhodopseudomonas sp. TaxID=1078 RepID=UPI003B3AF3F8
MTDKNNPTPAEPASQPLALAFDPQEFCHFLDDCDWTEPQKRAFIEELWKIVVGFVDLGFDLNPVQQAIGSRETLEEDSAGMLGLDNLEHFEPRVAVRQQHNAARTDS